MKHFLVILYMALCFLDLKAQQKEPLLYAYGYGVLWKLDYRSGKKQEICKPTPSDYRFIDDDATAFDDYNGRFFILSVDFNEQANPFPGDSSMLKQLYIAEADVKTGEVKYHKFKQERDYQSLRDLHFDVFSNSLIYGVSDTLKRYHLKNDSVEIIAKLKGASNYKYSKLTCFIPEKQVYISGRREIDGNDTQYVYYKYDLRSKSDQLYFTSKNRLENFAYSSTAGLYAFSDLAYRPHEIYSISENGDVKFVGNFADDKHIFWGQNSGFSGNRLLMSLSGSYNCVILEADVMKNSYEYITCDIGPIDGRTEFHTFNKPFILRNGDTLQTCYGKSYRWLWNGKPVENNANEQKHRPRQCGYYSVEVTFTDGRVDTSEAIYNNINDSKGQPITETFAAAYPNPFSESMNIRYKTCAEENTYIQVYDASGRQIVSQKIEKLPAGEHNFQLQTGSNLRYGIYFVKVFSGSELISTQKVMKL